MIKDKRKREIKEIVWECEKCGAETDPAICVVLSVNGKCRLMAAVTMCLL